jgi:predicted transcriptional regulator of viral defense system
MPQGGRPLTRDVLLDLAAAQNGLVTRRQAIDERDVHPTAVDALVARGRLKRVAHGIYRYPLLPGVEYEPDQVALLRTGDPDAALSHETALAIHDISDVNPSRYHVVVARPRRIRRNDNDRYVVHVQRLTPRQVTWWQQMPIVTPATAIEQRLEYGTPTYLLRQALDRSDRTGAVLRADLNRLTEALERRG